MATIRDVALLAGVSTATVSRLLSGDAPVSERSRLRVEAAVQQLGYTPNAIGRALRSQTSRTVALLVADIENPFLTSVVRGVEGVLRADGYSLLLFNSDEDPTLERQNLQVAREARPAGLIITPISEGVDLAAFTASKTPIVAVDRPLPGMGVDTVLVETRTAARRAVSHLYERGARRVALVTGPRGTYTAHERYKGFVDALIERGELDRPEMVRFTSYKADGAEAATLSLFEQSPPPDAMLVANSLLAVGTLRALRRLGLTVNDDVLFAAFDDAPWTGLLGQTLDVVRQPAIEVGHTAGQLLLKRIAHPDMGAETVLLHPTLSFVRSASDEDSHYGRGRHGGSG